MADKTLLTKIQVRRDSASNWELNKSVVLDAGEPSMETDTGIVKFGDGVTDYEHLPEIGGRASHYEGVKSGDETDQQVIDRVLEEAAATPRMDDIFVVKAPISDDKVSYTAYVYNGSAWAAMDGNYSAENVYFPKDLVFTYAFGKYTPSGGKVTVPAGGKNMTGVFADAFSEDIMPKITQPSVSLTSNEIKAYEAGTKVTPKYSATLNPGSYEFGPATGITATSWSVSNGSETLTEASGTFPEITVADDTNYSITATVQYADGAMPKTALGADYADGQIKAGSKSATKSRITGYRRYFYGVDTTSGEINSALIRGLTGSSGAAAAGTITINSKAGATRIIVALPTDSGLKVTNAILTTSMNADITKNYVKTGTVQVEGADAYQAVSYDLYVYQPASIDAGEIHKVTIGK